MGCTTSDEKENIKEKTKFWNAKGKTLGFVEMIVYYRIFEITPSLSFILKSADNKEQIRVEFEETKNRQNKEKIRDTIMKYLRTYNPLRKTNEINFESTVILVNPVYDINKKIIDIRNKPGDVTLLGTLRTFQLI